MQGIWGPMQLSWEFVLIEKLVPQDHLVRKLHAVLYLDFIYEQALYSKMGRPSIDPVVLVKFPTVRPAIIELKRKLEMERRN